MKKYDVLEHNGYMKAVSQSFNWGAFLFGMFYFLYKGSLKWAGIYFLAALGLGLLIVGTFHDSDSIAMWKLVATIGLALVAGIKANSFLEEGLISDGFRKIGTVDASSEEEAKEQAKKLIKSK